NNVYIWQDSEETNQNREPWLDGEVPLQLNEQLELPYRAKTSGIVYLRCKSGESAAVRYWRLI
ncbi:MAG: hypothetical protein KKD44_27655, partial [Proteobacteria bacterium]|nr:hypothetical protein [Pseudomonadota bacterium]